VCLRAQVTVTQKGVVLPLIDSRLSEGLLGREVVGVGGRMCA
jgi:hypothetical protein